jgi:hypothetical protein
MARPRTPTEVLDVRGSFIVHPSREKERQAEPVSDRALGEPPSRLDAETQAVWREVSSELLPGVGKESDRQMFEVLIRLLAKMRKGTIRIMELNALVSLCGRFAMTPSDRSKVAVGAEPSTALTRFLNSRISRPPDA